VIFYLDNQLLMCFSAGNIMENVNIHSTLDPRKQELLEARFLGGRVSLYRFKMFVDNYVKTCKNFESFSLYKKH